MDESDGKFNFGMKTNKTSINYISQKDNTQVKFYQFVNDLWKNHLKKKLLG